MARSCLRERRAILIRKVNFKMFAKERTFDRYTQRVGACSLKFRNGPRVGPQDGDGVINHLLHDLLGREDFMGSTGGLACTAPPIGVHRRSFIFHV
jgi:hypothetical protein